MVANRLETMGRLKSLYQKTKAFLVTNQDPLTRRFPRRTMFNATGLAYESADGGQGWTSRPADLEDLAGPFMGLNMKVVEPGDQEATPDQVLRSVFGNAL